MAVDAIATAVDTRQAEIEGEQAQAAEFHNRLDSADMREYRDLRKKGMDAVQPAAELASKEKPVEAKPAAETPEAKSARERESDGKFKSAKPRENPEARTESIQAEINRKTWERHEAERQLEETRAETARLRAEADAARTAAQPKPKQAGAAFPAFDQWLGDNPGKSYDDWQDAKYDARVEARFAAEENSRKQKAFQQTADEQVKSHLARVEKAKERYPDWDQVAQQVARIQPPPSMIVAIMGSERSDDIAYWLATHPTEYAQLARENANLDPAVAAPLVRRVLESYLPSAAQNTSPAQGPKKSSANPPPKLVGSSPQTADVDAEDETPDQYRARRESEIKARGRKIVRRGQ